VPSAPEGRVEEVIVSGAAVTDSEIFADTVCVELSESFTSTVKLAVPLAIVVPEMIPDPVARFKPEGRLPEAIDHV
jgi:hypothetical protein